MELLTVRIPAEMKERLEQIARREHRPLSNLVRFILMKWLEQHEEEIPKK